jgi:uncharacterized protein YqhQ
MAQSILYINMYIPVTGTVGAKHSSHIRLFKEHRLFPYKQDVNLQCFQKSTYYAGIKIASSASCRHKSLMNARVQFAATSWSLINTPCIQLMSYVGKWFAVFLIIFIPWILCNIWSVREILKNILVLPILDFCDTLNQLYITGIYNTCTYIRTVFQYQKGQHCICYSKFCDVLQRVSENANESVQCT